jgi:hypothetical protein
LTAIVVLDGQMHRPRAALDGQKQKALAALAVAGAQLGQVLHVDVHEAEIIVLEGAAAASRSALGRQSAQPFGPEDARDAVAVEMRQEVAHHEGEIIEGKTRGPTQGADNRPLLVGGFPRQLVWAAGAILAGVEAALAPLANGLGAHPIALGQHTRRFARAGDLGAHGWGGAGVGMDGEHHRPAVLSAGASGGMISASKRHAYSSIAQPTRSQ